MEELRPLSNEEHNHCISLARDEAPRLSPRPCCCFLDLRGFLLLEQVTPSHKMLRNVPVLNIRRQLKRALLGLPLFTMFARIKS